MQEITILDDIFLFQANQKPRRGAIAFDPGGILAAGERDAVRSNFGKKSRVISLPGALVLPGICDGHTHMLSGALQLTRIDLRSVKSREEFSSKIRAWADANPSLPWILGQWADTFLGGDLPARQWVDDVSRGKPLFLTRFDMHSALANTRALEIAGVSKRSPDPSGGKIVRDPRTSEATGLLLEKAMDLVAVRIPPMPDAERARALQKSFRLAQGLGITQVHDVISHWRDLDVYRAALGQGPGVKVFARVPFQELDRLLSGLEGEPSGRLVLDGGQRLCGRKPGLGHGMA